MSTAASVWPPRSSTPPGRARSGSHVARAAEVVAGLLEGSASALIVRARSPAEIPVVTPSLRSTVTAKAVPFGSSFFDTIGPSFSPRAMSRKVLAGYNSLSKFAVHIHARRVPHDEGHGLLAHGLRREDQVALVFSISIVGDYDGPAVPHLLEGLFYGLLVLDTIHWRRVWGSGLPL